MAYRYYVDAENVNGAWLNLLPHLEQEDQIYVMRSVNVRSVNVPFDMMELLCQRHQQITYIDCEVGRIGKSAMDFQLASYMGYMIARFPVSAEVIVSNDTGYDPLIKFWERRGVMVMRYAMGQSMESGAAYMAKIAAERESATLRSTLWQQNLMEEGAQPVAALPQSTPVIQPLPEALPHQQEQRRAQPKPKPQPQPKAEKKPQPAPAPAAAATKAEPQPQGNAPEPKPAPEQPQAPAAPAAPVDPLDKLLIEPVFGRKSSKRRQRFDNILEMFDGERVCAIAAFNLCGRIPTNTKDKHKKYLEHLNRIKSQNPEWPHISARLAQKCDAVLGEVFAE